MTKINCILTGCQYNSGCCISSKDYGSCNKENIQLNINIEDALFECEDYVLNTDKAVYCNICQIKEHGEIKLQPYLEFEYVDTDDIPF